MIPRALTPAAFAARRPGVPVRSFSGRTMGTSWSLQVVDAPASAGESVRRALDRVVRQMSQWEAESDLSRLNRAPAGEWHAIPPEFARVMAAATAIAEASGGAFNPALGLLTERWGFGAAGPVAAVPEIAPPDAPPDIAFDAAAARVRRGTGAALDLSGIAKGFGADLAAEQLLASGVRHFLIEVGGELRGEGLQPDAQPWWVDVEPPPGQSLAPWRLALHDLSVATSGNYRRGFTDGCRHYSHSFDPRSGRPLVNGVASVTVVHRSCMIADGWATALTVVGPEQGMALADAQGLAMQMIADGREYVSREWRAMLD
ncbi:thiamine biosynthesis protein ApbE [Sphingopyxis terrae subsp. terrae NBRC 15098]|uniref:FAD:protein FMN transferase n=1 Tax=Sphingopyxis terrae subsp. terrae NBRC 15098 TaxID=1219058 RepID=A0A142W2W6_9SPHN|nr:FAD:protein FMN transferase [Sphingopyxis terrae]AMU96302.1 thiamine biosynthesis protein ApbE [Sphingopyxis terrae subsp. terrae NBRC 15098]